MKKNANVFDFAADNFESWLFIDFQPKDCLQVPDKMASAQRKRRLGLLSNDKKKRINVSTVVSKLPNFMSQPQCLRNFFLHSLLFLLSLSIYKKNHLIVERLFVASLSMYPTSNVRT
jgi:hypothetical protein